MGDRAILGVDIKFTLRRFHMLYLFMAAVVVIGVAAGVWLNDKV